MDLGTFGTYIKNAIVAKINALLPSQSGNSGKVLSTNGTVLSWVDAGSGSGGTPTVFHSQTDLNIDGNNGNFFLITPPDNSSIGFSLSNISAGIVYYFLIGNTVGTSIVIPNTADKCVNHNIIVGANKYPLIAMIYTGTERIWTVSEELGV